MGRGPKPAKGRVEAKSPVSRKSPRNDRAKVRDLEKQLAEALRDRTQAQEQQAATAEILSAISRSATDLQPVLEAVVENASRLCGAGNVSLYQVEGPQMRKVAEYGGPLTSLRVGETRPITRMSMSGRAILDRTTVHVPDHQGPEAVQEYPEARRDTGIRTSIGIPLLREQRTIGAFTAYRTEARPFSVAEIALLQTFADQAVIAIENVRLFNETKEALEQQTATSEILKVIARSPIDTQPVFDAIAQSGRRLCDGNFCTVVRYDGELLHLAASAHITAEGVEAMKRNLASRPSRAMALGRAILDGAVVLIPDVLADAEYDQSVAQAVQLRSIIAVPMLRDGTPIGAISVSRAEARPFTETEIALLQTFADQAVIAIENVRLFNETKEALERQTATAEVLKVISQSPTQVQPIFDAIVRSAVRLCDGVFSIVLRFDGEVVHFAAQHNFDPNARAVYGRWFPRRVADDHLLARVLVEQRIVNLADVTTEFRFVPGQQEQGFRSVLWVPMIHDGVSVGAIGVSRLVVEPFPDNQVELLKTFADQAVIAIENVRLFTELQERNREVEQKSRELAAASQHKSEFLANMSHELRTPLNAIIGFSEVLGERMFGELNEKQEEYLKDIYASGQHLLSLINDILDLSKIEAGRMELELTDFNLPATLDNALTLVRERAGRRGIALGLTVDERLEQIHADERKVRQVVLNLLSNAIKFTPEGGRIEVRAAPVDGVVEISVSDTGVGIAPEDQEVIFEEFKQVGTAAKKVEGTGLGLALSRKFIELHGGRIWVESQVGVGSTFTLTIPMRT
jgi:signal transduction histidine kinase